MCLARKTPLRSPRCKGRRIRYEPRRKSECFPRMSFSANQGGKSSRLITSSAKLRNFLERAKGENQSRWPQCGQGASPGGRDGSICNSFPQTGQRFGSPSGVRDDGSIRNSAGPGRVGCGYDLSGTACTPPFLALAVAASTAKRRQLRDSNIKVEGISMLCSKAHQYSLDAMHKAVADARKGPPPSRDQRAEAGQGPQHFFGQRESDSVRHQRDPRRRGR